MKKTINLKFQQFMDRNFECPGKFIDSFKGWVSFSCFNCNNGSHINIDLNSKIDLGHCAIFSKFFNPVSQLLVSNHVCYPLTKSDINVIKLSELYFRFTQVLCINL